MNFETRQNMANEIWQIDALSALDRVHQQIRSNTLNTLASHKNQRHAHGAVQSYWHSCFKLMAPLQVQIERVSCEESNTYIELKNTGPAIIDLENWYFECAASNEAIFTFPKNSYIKPNQVIKVEQQQSTFMFNSTKHLLCKDGSQIKLFDAEGGLISCWINGSKAHNSLIISHINHDSISSGKDKHKDHIELINLSTYWVDLTDWVVKIKNGPSFKFPKMSKMEPCSEMKIFANHSDEDSFSFASNHPIFNKDNILVSLLDHNNQLVNEYHCA